MLPLLLAKPGLGPIVARKGLADLLLDPPLMIISFPRSVM